MPFNQLSTSKVARAAGCHPNTVRLFEAQGYIPTAERSKAGYRLFTEYHQDQMVLAVTALQWPYPGGKAPVEQLVRLAANKELTAALDLAKAYQVRIEQEISYAQAAVHVLEQWAGSQKTIPLKNPLRIWEASRLLGISADALRNWERNGLITIPRGPNGYRQYNEPEISWLRVIRVLRQAGYSMMAILRTIHHLQQGSETDIEDIIGNPPEDENVITAADRWLSTLEVQKLRAKKIIMQLELMTYKYPTQ